MTEPKNIAKQNRPRSLFSRARGTLRQAITISRDSDGEHRSLQMKIQDEMSKNGNDTIRQEAADIQKADGLKVPGGLTGKNFMDLLH